MNNLIFRFLNKFNIIPRNYFSSVNNRLSFGDGKKIGNVMSKLGKEASGKKGNFNNEIKFTKQKYKKSIKAEERKIDNLEKKGNFNNEIKFTKQKYKKSIKAEERKIDNLENYEKTGPKSRD
eukprot:TRINITY_DN79_c1_g1_i2.p1 TRINITY_DN79_c1_g1~~TRINITY_DN79_c1_g1_i2.p1  ORF type:complete len:122 (+),score=18.28 TRINITY_DN79_c1_g1_i2:62-427(+)